MATRLISGVSSDREALDELQATLIDLAGMVAAGTLVLENNERLNWSSNQAGVFTAQITIQNKAEGYDAQQTDVPAPAPAP